jgi:hypothetical protein
LRRWRALEVLERLGTAEARKCLRELAEGPAEDALTSEAAAVQRRLRPEE